MEEKAKLFVVAQEGYEDKLKAYVYEQCLDLVLHGDNKLRVSINEKSFLVEADDLYLLKIVKTNIFGDCLQRGIKIYMPLLLDAHGKEHNNMKMTIDPKNCTISYDFRI